jgi:Domain of unknown function (DUF4276)
LIYTLVSDGPSDRALLPILTWALRRQGFRGLVNPQWADLRRLRHRPSALGARVQLSVELYPCELLFVHRDAETQSPANRVKEIEEAVESIEPPLQVPFVPVVPVRMMEAWLLFDENAIRSAAGNPNGTDPLALPRLRHVENLPNPKANLHELICNASGHGTRRRQRVNARRLAYRIADLVDDFSPLEQVPAFVEFSAELRRTLERSEI